MNGAKRTFESEYFVPMCRREDLDRMVITSTGNSPAV